MNTYDVAAYIWPAYTGDEKRSRIFWPEGMGEWQSVKSAVKKHPSHTWPRRPLWGYPNEADPFVMEGQIRAALNYGVNVFIYDWYWYDRRPFLENCLNDGFLKAPSNKEMKFYLMWANHDAGQLWDKRNSDDHETVVWLGSQNEEEFRILASRVIRKFFVLDNYYKIDGKPVFMIYDVPNFVKGLGGVQKAKEAIEWFREEAVKCGLKGVHLQFALWSPAVTNITGVDGGKDVPAEEFSTALGFDSLTHYQFVHFVDVNRDYMEILPDVKKEWDKIDRKFDIPYFPHVSVGWDNNPRFNAYVQPEMKGTTPENIEKGFAMAKEYADSHPDQPKLITVNSWNEWTETSYLQPDDVNGYGYLEAIRRVFKGE